MKIRIEGCTAEQLAECSDYLTLGKDYALLSSVDDPCYVLTDDVGEEIVCGKRVCAHLPEGAKWVEVANEKAPS